MKTSLFCVLSMVLFFGCATEKRKLTEEGRKVEVIRGKAAKGCEVTGKIFGVNDFGSIQVATNHARNQAAEQGANKLLVEDEIINGKKVKVYAMGYVCP